MFAICVVTDRTLAGVLRGFFGRRVADSAVASAFHDVWIADCGSGCETGVCLEFEWTCAELQVNCKV
jgi:hypothetical protein